MKNKKIITIATAAAVVLMLLTVAHAGALKTNNFNVVREPMQNFHGVWGYVDQLPIPSGCVDGNMLPSMCPGGVGDTDFRLVCVVDGVRIVIRLTAEVGSDVFSGRARVDGELLFFDGVYSICNGFWVFSWMYEGYSFYLFGVVV